MFVFGFVFAEGEMAYNGITDFQRLDVYNPRRCLDQ